MKRSIFAIVCLQLIGMALFSAHAYAADAASIDVGGFDVTPSIKVSEVHNDNIFNQEIRKTSSWFATIEPGISITAEKGISQIEVTYLLSQGIYHSSSNDNYLDHFAGISADFDLSSRLQAGIAVNYSQTHDPRGSTFTGTAIFSPTPDEYHETVVDGNIGYGVNARIDLNGEYLNKRYDNNQAVTRVRDLDEIGGGAAFSYPVGPNTKAVLEARYKRFDYTVANILDSTEQRYFAGLDWEATAKTSGTLRLGYLKKAFNNAGLTDGSQFSWELEMLWEPTTYSNLSLATDSQSKETDGTGSYTKSTSSTLTWNHAWNTSLSHAAYVGYSNDEFQAATRTDKITTGGASVSYQLQRWLGIQSAYDYTKRDSNVTSASYTGNVWMLSLVGTL